MLCEEFYQIRGYAFPLDTTQDILFVDYFYELLLRHRGRGVEEEGKKGEATTVAATLTKEEEEDDDDN
ncbi:hypothetical protein AgCh_023737 [Apium graveolens]